MRNQVNFWRVSNGIAAMLLLQLVSAGAFAQGRIYYAPYSSPNGPYANAYSTPMYAPQPSPVNPYQQRIIGAYGPVYPSGMVYGQQGIPQWQYFPPPVPYSTNRWCSNGRQTWPC